MASGAGSEEPLDVLRRWEESGAVWRVISSSKDTVDIALLTCTAGEEIGRIHTSDPQVRAYLRSRTRRE